MFVNGVRILARNDRKQSPDWRNFKLDIVISTIHKDGGIHHEFVNAGLDVGNQGPAFIPSGGQAGGAGGTLGAEFADSDRKIGFLNHVFLNGLTNSISSGTSPFQIGP